MNIKGRVARYFSEDLPFFLVVPALLWELLFFCIPVFCLLAMSAVAHSYAHLAQFMYVKILVRSLVLALSVSVSALVIGYPVAYYLACKASRAIRTILLFFLMLPLWSNFLILMYAWYFVLEKHGLINTILIKLGLIKTPFAMLHTIGATGLVMMYCYLPFMILPIYVVLEKLDWTLIEASQDLGANMRQTFFKIIIPLSVPGILTGFLLVFVPAFGDFAIPMFIGGDKNMFVGNLIEYYFLVARNSSLGAAVTVVSCIVLVIVTLCLQWSVKKKFPDIDGGVE
jgi:spermidine/putrescine transport system permease protein